MIPSDGYLRFTVAIVLTAYNKWMFSEDHYGFSWPLFVTMLHMFVQFGFAALVRKLWPGRFRPSHNPNRKDYVLVMHLTLRLFLAILNLNPCCTDKRSFLPRLRLV